MDRDAGQPAPEDRPGPDARPVPDPALVVLIGPAGAGNQARNRPVPGSVLEAQLRRMPEVTAELAREGWALVVRSGHAVIEPTHSPGSTRAAGLQRSRPVQLGFILQISRFPWNDNPASWLRSVALAAAEAGFEGIALMDHLIQVPQVGRPWEPIPEPWVTLGMLAGLGTGLRLGTLVTPATFRAPGVLAKTVATLDALSDGAAFCGLGAGWWEREHAAYGLPFPSARDRLDQLELTIETPRALAARHESLPGRPGLAAGDDLLPASRGPGPDHCRRRGREAHAGDRGAAGRRLQPAV